MTLSAWAWMLVMGALSQAAPDGYITGRVVAADSGERLAYANIMVVGSTLGTMTDATGKYVLKAPPGQCRVRALIMGYRNAETDVVVATGDTIRADLRLDPRGLTRAQAEAESIGVDVHVSADELPCEIVAMKDRFIVGDDPAFTMTIHNGSSRPVVLVVALDGSELGNRYPNIEWRIVGPDGPVAPARYYVSQDLKFLEAAAFVFVPPGVDFDPYGQPAAKFWESHGYDAFDRPGRYTITVTYRTDEPDIRRWMSWEESSLAPGVSEAVRRVPRVALTASMVVNVEAQ